MEKITFFIVTLVLYSVIVQQSSCRITTILHGGRIRDPTKTKATPKRVHPSEPDATTPSPTPQAELRRSKIRDRRLVRNYTIFIHTNVKIENTENYVLIFVSVL